MFQLQLAAAALNCKGPVCSSMYSGTQRNMDSGYPLDWFAEKVDEKYICEICGKVVQSPRATPCCSNTYCLHCLEFWIEYYGVCPKRCGEIDSDGLKKDPVIEKSIQALPVRCKYPGCEAKLVLEDKLKHERKCQFKQEEQGGNGGTVLDSTENERRSSTQSQDTYVEMASVACRNKTAVDQVDGGGGGGAGGSTNRANLHPIFHRDLAYYTYNLTRRSPGESLGFVLVAGAKNSNGKAVNFSIKSVNPNTVAAEAGLLPGDRIVQVDNIPLSQLAQPEAISKIKDNPHVILTIIRSNPMNKAVRKHRRSLEDHVYEDIPNSEEHHGQNLQIFIPSAAGFRERIGGYTSEEMMSIRHTHRRTSDSRINQRHMSPTLSSDGVVSRNGTRLVSEKMSKDSGLSSCSSSSPTAGPGPHHHHFNNRQMIITSTSEDQSVLEHHHHQGSKHSYQMEREAMKKSVLEREHSDPVQSHSSSHHHQSSDDLNVEEIYLQKNGTNQLGITLGYDTKSSSGNLIVCEIVPDGLAAKDGRLKRGDIIQKVNGFEVYDPEEAILLFLEQDQDITLTVARKSKSSRRRRHNMLTSKSQSSLTHLNETSDLRRTDSCGSLDSMTHKETEESPRRHSESNRRVYKTSVSSTGRTFNAPTISSSGYTTEQSTNISSSTDFVFRPINDTRPATAGDITQPGTRYLRSTTSLGSDPERSMSNHFHHGHNQQQQHQLFNPVSRHRSFEGTEHHQQRLLKSPTQFTNKLAYRAPSPLKNSSRSFFSDSPGMTDQVAPMDNRAMMFRSMSSFRCESLV